MQIKKFSLFFLLFFSFAFAEAAKVKAYFPKDQLADRLVEAIESEKTSIKVAIYSITHRGIAEALVRAKQRGVAVEVIVDPFSVKKYSSIHKLLEGKVPLFVWDKGIQMGQKGKRRGLMHDKFCIFGGEKVWTGSFNFTYDSEKRHRENALLIESRPLAQQYLSQFSYMQLYESRPYMEYISLYPKKKRQKKGG